MSLVPDMFEYEGPLDLTEYFVRRTELRTESGNLVRVKVSTQEKLKEKFVLFLVLDFNPEEIIEPYSHDIPAHHSHEYHRSHV